MIEQFLKQIHFNQWSWLVPWLVGLSAIIFVGSIIVGWMVLVRLPEDYLTRDESPNLYRSQSKLANLLIDILRNALGIGFLFVGFVMLFTPGQGILSITVGIVLVEFPGKHKLIRRMLANHRILNAINRIRRKSNKRPLASKETINSTPS
jgi:hypothetical protein